MSKEVTTSIEMNQTRSGGLRSGAQENSHEKKNPSQTRQGVREILRENSEGKKPISQTRATLKPVQPPSKREVNSSIEVVPFNDYMNSGGYSSPGQDSDSTRISNLR